MREAPRFRNRHGFGWMAIASLACLLCACATSPLGHRQLKLLPEDELAQTGEAAFDKIQQESRVIQDPQTNAYVSCVVRKITAALGSDRQWQVAVLADDTPNAFALPGGRIGVNSGLLTVAQNQDQLAAVIGHEIAHVRADHANARLSAAYAAQAASGLAAAVVGGGQNSQQIMGLLGVGVQYGVIMPYSRSQESEADLLGLRYMSEAGFDPRASIDLWRNMARAGGDQPPAFLSTHPSHGDRIEALQAHMPEARQRYRSAQAQGLDPSCARAGG